ncbi:hypothetical protein [Thalassotalea crassostreae]|uniref:hypothetical protein n=1 Tax=Thalassotalea crassostreae TaxID=1763536 RepID=UPI0008395A47|nr:hypothetical protein [Thalassotalea crassostreae]
MLRIIALILPLLLMSYNANGIVRQRYPILPPNFDKISQGIMHSVCDRAMQGKNSGGFDGLMNDIRKYYGDPREFFYKYVMSLPCRSPSVSLADSILKKDFINTAFSNIFMKFGGVDPNSFVVIKREGLIFEGPLHVVYKHLEKHFKDSPNYGPEYRGVVMRLTVKRFVNGTPKSCKELQKEDPRMPCILPLPKK